MYRRFRGHLSVPHLNQALPAPPVMELKARPPLALLPLRAVDDRALRPGTPRAEVRLDALHSVDSVNVARIQRQKLGSFLASFLVYSGVFFVTTFSGWAVYPILQGYLRHLSPEIYTLDLAEVGQPLGLAITIFGITFGNLLATTLGFNFSRLQSIRIALYDEAAQMGLLLNDLLIVFKDVPDERESSFRCLLQHAKCTYYTSDQVAALHVVPAGPRVGKPAVISQGHPRRTGVCRGWKGRSGKRFPVACALRCGVRSRRCLAARALGHAS